MTHPSSRRPQAAKRTAAEKTMEVFQQALAAHQRGDLAGAEPLYRQVLQSSPQHADAWHLLGVLAYQQGRLKEAQTWIGKAIAIQPQAAVFHANLGNVRVDLKMQKEALESYDQALALEPDMVDALYNRGRLLKDLQRPQEALASYDRALALQAQAPHVHNSRGNVLMDLQRFEDALASFDLALQLRSNFVEAQNNRGNALLRLRRLDEALAMFDQVIAQQPSNAEAHRHRGHALMQMQKPEQVVNSLNRAIALQPGDADAHYHRAHALKALHRHELALQSYRRAYQLKRDCAFNLGYLVHLQCQLCQWDDLEPLIQEIAQGVQAGKAVTPPFPWLALVDDPQLHLAAARIWAQENARASGILGPVQAAGPRGKIHIAYLSADFHQHATCHLMAQLFELHDRQRFERTAISFGPDRRDPMRQRVAAAFDRFVDARNMSDIDVARLCRTLGVDIAVDLKGYTSDARPGILAERCAPLQINYLGFPGSLGADFVDHIVADPVLIAPEETSNYSEKVVWLPDSYMVNDGLRPMADATPTRDAVGLPETGFVFCCFNNNYKILPATFDVWMRILQRVPGSVLWLLEDNATAAKQLRHEAQKRGVAPERLVFAGRMAPDLHLARHRLADLFIDTWPYNAHTTASDALWAGLPLLTRKGRSFASRVAASLLQAVGLPELITHDDVAYENLAVALALEPQRLGDLRQRLGQNRARAALFDCARFTRNLEEAFEKLLLRHGQGLPPDHLVVSGVGKSAASNPVQP